MSKAGQGVGSGGDESRLASAPAAVQAPAPRGLRLAAGGLLAALVAVSAQIMVPVPPVPFTLQTLAVGLTGLILPPGEAALALGVYLGLGMFLPVFSGLRGGLGVLLGPTGGFLFAFPVQAALTSWCARLRARPSFAWLVGSQLLGLVPVFALGTVGLAIFGGLAWGKAGTTVVVYLPGGAVKALLGAMLYRSLAGRLPPPYRVRFQEE